MPVPSTRPRAERQLLRDTVHEQIRRAILDGTLRPGERLHDDELIAWLGVSRTPIREALAELARRGLVEMAANRYTRVARPSPDDLLDAFRTLGILFGGLVRITVPTLSEGQRRTILAGLDETIRRFRAHEVEQLTGDSVAIYERWLATCPNERLVATVRRALDGLAFGLRVAEIDEIVPWESITGHVVDLRDAVARGDAVGAELAMAAIHQVPAV